MTTILFIFRRLVRIFNCKSYFKMYRLAFLFLIFVDGAKSFSTGAYKLSLLNISNCNGLDEMSRLQIPLHVEKYQDGGRSLVRYNFTVKTTTIKGLRMRVVMSTIKKGVPTPVIEIEGSACSHHMLKGFATLAGVRLNYEDCSFEKGSYAGDGINVDSEAHKLTKVFPYGIAAVHLDWKIPIGLVLCQDLFVEAKPIVKMKI